MVAKFLLFFGLGTVLPVVAAYRNSAQWAFTSKLSPTQNCYNYCGAELPSAGEYTVPVRDGQLVLVQVIARHGDRTPKTVYGNTDITWDCDAEHQHSFLSSNATSIQPERALITREMVSIPMGSPFERAMWSGSCGIGALTPRGAAYQRKLGYSLREIYVDKMHYLPKMFNGKGFFVRSTDYSRTKQSAYSLISGLYPDRFRPDDSVVNMITVPRNIEYMVGNEHQCPKAKRMMKKMMRQKPFRAHLKENKELMTKLHTVFKHGWKHAWPKKAFSPYVDFLLPRRCHGQPLPCDKNKEMCITDADIDKVLELSHWELSYLFRDAGMADRANRLTIGSFLAELRESLFRHAKYAGEGGHFGQHTKGNQSTIEIFSAHDETITALLGALRARDMRWPAYSSSIIVELWRAPESVSGPSTGLASYDSFYVRIMANGAVIDAPWCNFNACPVRVLWENTRHLIPHDIERECGMEYPLSDDEV